MGIQNWSDKIVLVDLSQEPDMVDDLEAVAEMLNSRDDFDVVIDFSGVDMITSSSLSRLLKLREPLADCGRRLVLCGVVAAVRGVFAVTGLDGVFELADDKFAALATLEMIG